MMKKRFILSITILLLGFNSLFSQLIVDYSTPYDSPTYLVDSVLMGSGVIATGVTFTGTSQQIAFFDGSASSIGINQGIIMATGDCMEAIGPNSSGSITLGGAGSGSDPDLVAIAGVPIFDAAVLEFDFVPIGDSVRFRYSFASDEYNEYACSGFNDAFGFFISGPGFAGPFTGGAENIALIPGTTTPVAINTINLGVAGSAGTASTCTAANPTWTTDNIYFVNNETIGTGTIEYDGYTVVLEALAEVQCGVSYHIKLAIGDAGDAAFDSGVFLEASSFTSSGTIDATVADIDDLIACGGPPYDLNFTGNPDATDHFWDFGDGSGTSILENPLYTYADTGTYTVMYVAIDSSGCYASDTAFATIQVIQPDSISASIDVGPWDPCEPDSMNVLLEFTGTGADSIVWDMGDGTIYIDDTLVNHNYTSQGTYIITMTGWDQCGNVQVITDTVDYNGIGFNVNVSINNYSSCADPPVDVPFTGDGSVPDHYWDFGDGSTSILQDPIHTYADTGTYNIMYIGIDSSSCNVADTAYATITVSQAEQFDASWSLVPPDICEDTMFVDVAFSGSGTDSLVWDMGDGTIFINDTSVDYFYTTAGTYTISMTAYDFQCNNTGTVSETFIYDPQIIGGLIQVPNVFSPNGDNYNDEFRLSYIDRPWVDPMDDMEEYHIQIYNRWGKMVFESGSSKADWAWDGKVDGNDADEGVYYYILTYQYICEEAPVDEVHGNISLFR